MAHWTVRNKKRRGGEEQAEGLSVLQEQLLDPFLLAAVAKPSTSNVW